jgi:predicted nucleic acid-binding protein
MLLGFPDCIAFGATRQQAYNLYTEFRHQKIRIGTQDLRIASIALANNYILITRNKRDFSNIFVIKLCSLRYLQAMT